LLVHQGTNGLSNFRYIRKFRNTGVSSSSSSSGNKYRIKVQVHQEFQMSGVKWFPGVHQRQMD
jgi:hypothetical protein